MRRFQSSALILDVVDLRERDRIVSLLTPENGRIRGVARGARAKYSRFAGQLQLLSKVDVRWFEKEGRDLVSLSDIALRRPAAGMQRDLEGILLSSYLAEHMMEFAQEHETSDRLFRLLDTTVEALLGGVDRSLAARYLEVWVLRLSGIFPVPRECPHCGRPLHDEARLLESEGSLVCDDCAASGPRVGAPVLDFLRRTGGESLPRIQESWLGDPRGSADAPAVLERVEDLCGRIRRQFLQHELKSYQVMRRTLATV